MTLQPEIAYLHKLEHLHVADMTVMTIIVLIIARWLCSPQQAWVESLSYQHIDSKSGCLNTLRVTWRTGIFARHVSLGDEGWKPLTEGPCFQVFSTIQGKTRAKRSFCSEAAWGSTIAIITPMCQAHSCGSVRALVRVCPTPRAPKHWEWKPDVHDKS